MVLHFYIYIFALLKLLFSIEYFYTVYKNIYVKSQNNTQISFLFSSFFLLVICYYYFMLNNSVSSIFIFSNVYIYDLLNIVDLNITIHIPFYYYFKCFLDILNINSLNINFLLLTTLLIFLCIIYNSEIHIYNINYMNMIFLILEILLLILFSTSNVLLFFIFFEATLVPMVALIAVWGSRQRKIHSMYYLYMYTMVGSVFFIFGLLKLYNIAGTFDIMYLQQIHFNIYDELILFICFFISFAIKVPMWPWHIWLPEAHVESPTTGSVLLAGILLKLGTYGMLRYLIPLTPNITTYLTPFIYTLAIMGVIYSSLIILRLVDLKKIIAYSSVIHMNILIIGLFSLSYTGVGGSIFMMLNHGIVSSGLFLIIGVLYDRYHSRIIFYYKGLNKYMPLLNFIFITFTLANIALPGTSSFISEFIILLGIYEISSIISIIVCSCCITSAIYGLWLYSRIMYGFLNNNKTNSNIIIFCDLTERELLVFLPLVTFIFFLGVLPSITFTLLNQETLISLIGSI